MMMGICLIAVALCLAPITVWAEKPSDKSTIAVLEFSSSSLSDEEMLLFSDQIASYIAENGLFTVIGRSEREAVLQEQEFSLSDLAEARQSRELGRLLSAQYLLTGNIGNIGASRFWMNIKMIDTRTGEVARSISKEYRSLTQLLDDCKKMTLALIDPESHGSKEYTLIYGPEHHEKYNFIGVGYHHTNFLLTEIATGGPLRVITDGASLWFAGIQGSSLAIQWSSNFFFPLSAIKNDEPIDLSVYTFPWGVDVFFGPGYIASLGPRLKLMVSIDAHYTQLTLWPTKRMEDMHLMLVYIAFGVGADLSLLYRLQEANYIRLGCVASLDLINVMQNLPMPQGGALEQGLTIAPYLMIGSAR